MGLKLANPPNEGMDVVNAALMLLAGRDVARTRSMTGSGTSSSKQKLSQPQEVYQIPLNCMVSKNPLEFAEPVAWRYLVMEGDDAVEAAETTLGGSVNVSFSQVNRGPQISGFVDATHLAEKIADETPRQEWELRYLRIPSLYVDALWMHEAPGLSNRLIPISPLSASLDVNKAYSPEDFFGQLRMGASLRFNTSDDSNG